MNYKKITSLEIGILSTFLYKAFVLINGFNILININQSDSIISIIIGFLFGFIIVSLFLKAADTLPKLNIFEKNTVLFTKPISFIINGVLIITTIIFSSYNLYISSLFIRSALLNNVDILPISILFLCGCMYLASKGIQTLCKSSIISFLLFLIFELITIILTIPNVNSIKLLPLFTSPIPTTIYSSIIYLTISILPIFLLLMIPKESIKDNKKHNKYIRLSYIVTNIYIIFNFILVLSIINVRLASIIDYPELSILSKISVLNFFDRMEDILSFKFLLDLFITLSLSLIYIKEGINKIVNNIKIKKYLNIVLLILILFISNYIEMNSYVIIYSLILFAVLSILVLTKNKTYLSD